MTDKQEADTSALKSPPPAHRGVTHPAPAVGQRHITEATADHNGVHDTEDAAAAFAAPKALAKSAGSPDSKKKD